MSLASLGKDPQYMSYLGSLEDKYGLPSGILATQQKAESNFNPDAVSPAGAIGIAQFMPDTAKQYGINPKDPMQAADGQARMLADLGRKYNGDVPSVLAAYNWGSGNLDRKGMANAPAETRGYIEKIMAGLPGQSDSVGQDAPGALSRVANAAPASPLEKIMNAVGEAIIPSANAAEMSPEQDPMATMQNAQQQALQPPAQPAANPYAQMSDADLAKEAQKHGIQIAAPANDYSKMSDDQLRLEAQKYGIDIKQPISREAGIAAGGVAKGAAMLPAMGADVMGLPENAARAFMTYMANGKKPTEADFTPTGNALQSTVSQITPTPAGSGERILQDASTGVGAMATGGGMGSLKALLSGAVGGLTSGATREAGGSPLLQMVAGLAGGGGAYVGAKAIQPAAESALAKVSGMFGKEGVTGKTDIYSSIMKPDGSPLKGSDRMVPLKDITPEQADAQLAKVKTAIPSSEDFTQRASQSYSLADAKGGFLKPSFTNEFITRAANVMPQTKEGLIVAGETPVTKLIDRMQALKDKPISLKGAQEIDETLGDEIDNYVENGKLSKQGKKLFDVQTEFRNMIMETKPKDVVGGKEGFDAWKQGQQDWSKAMRMRDIEKMIVRSEGMANPAQGMRTMLNTMNANPSRMRGFTGPTIRAAIDEARQTKLSDEALRLAGSRLNPIISGATGHLGGAIAGHVAGIASRGAAQKIQLYRMNKILEAIANEKPKGAK